MLLKDPIKCREYNREWYRKNKEHRLLLSKNYYSNNKGNYKKKHKEWYDNNKERRLFKSSEWLKNNNAHKRQKDKESRERIKIWLREYKLTLKCSRCSETHFACLEFHHEDKNKEFNVSRASKYSIKRVKKEIDKCIVLCANCHRKEHNKEALMK